MTRVLRQNNNQGSKHFIHGPRGIQRKRDDAGNRLTHMQDGLGSVRGLVDSAAQVQSSINYTPYGQPQGTYSSEFGFTGEYTDPNGQVYLRARCYDPSLSLFMALDPFEGVTQRPMSLNGYSWVEGNPINHTDANGLFSCSGDDATVSGACDELKSALVRSRQSGLQLDEIVTNTVGSDGVLDLKSFVRQSEKIFGLQFKAPGEIFGNSSLDLINLDDCTFELIGNSLSVSNVSTSNSVLVKTDVLRSVAAMVHITSKFGEKNFSNPLGLFRNALIGNYIEILASENSETIGGGGQVPRGQGRVVLGESRNDIRIGTGATIATIVHELGHAFDRSFGLIPSNIISSGVRYSSSETRFVFPGETSIPNDILNLTISGEGSDGMLTRANASADAPEVWADVFMTWVMNGIDTPTNATSNSGSPGWDCSGRNNSGMANMWNQFASGLMLVLLRRGSLFGTREAFLKSTAKAISQSAQNPCS